MNKFMTHGEFNTLKTAQNTWGKIKGKLISVAGEAKPEEDDAAANLREAAAFMPRMKDFALIMGS